MVAPNELFEEQNKGPIWRDADTVIDPVTGKPIRVGGVDTRETTKLQNGGDYTSGQVGAEEAFDASRQLAELHGLDTIYDSGVEDATGSRNEGDVINPETGESLSAVQLRTGLSGITEYSSAAQVNQALFGRLDRANRAATNTRNEEDAIVDVYRHALNSEELTPKILAKNEAQLAFIKKESPYADMFSDSAVEVRSSDRNINNEAKSYVRSGLALGKSSLQEAGWGFLSILEDTLRLDSSVGQDNVDRIKREVQDLPAMKDLEAFDENGKWSIDGVRGYWNFIAGNAAVMAPEMAAVLLAAATGPVGGLTVPSLLHTGRTYANQENKNIPVAALTGAIQGSLEYAGAVLTGGGLNLAAKAIAKGGPDKAKIFEEIASKTKRFKNDPKGLETFVAESTARELANISSIYKDALAKRLQGKYLVPAAAGHVLKEGAGEAATEVGQEFVGHLGENWDRLGETDRRELLNRLLNAAVAGGALGGTISVGQTGAEIRGDFDALSSANQARYSNKDFDRQQDLRNEREGTDISDLVEESQESSVDINKWNDVETKKTFADSAWEKVRDVGSGSITLGNFAFLDNKYGRRGKNVVKALALAEGNKVYSGGGLETNQSAIRAKLNALAGRDEETLATFRTARDLNEISNIMTDPEVTPILDEISEIRNQKNNRNKSFFEIANLDGIQFPERLQAHRQSILDYATKLDDVDVYTAELEGKPQVTGNAWNTKALDKQKIFSNKAQFISDVVEAEGISVAKATQAWKDIIDLNDITTLDDVGVSAKGEPAGFDSIDIDNTTNRTQSIARNPKLDKYFSGDLFSNLAANNSKVASRVAKNDYLGANLTRPAYFIQKAVEANEINAQEAKEIAKAFQDYQARREGSYNRIESDFWRAANDNLMFYSTLSQLTLAPVSSLVEVGIATQLMNNKEIFKHIVQGGLKKVVTETHDLLNKAGALSKVGSRKSADALLGASEKKNKEALDKVTPKFLNRGATPGVNKKDLFAPIDNAKAKAQELGFEEEQQSAAYRHDARTDVKKQKWLNSFFTATGLTSVTNLTRQIPISVGMDKLREWADTLEGHIEGNPYTAAQQEAHEALQHLGVDIPTFLGISRKDKLTPADEKVFQANVDRALYQMVNDVVAFPTKANRPNFYQNPRMGLFFQFQGFISTITSQILPRLYKAAWRGNTIRERDRAIRTFGTMIAMGMLSLALTDMIKYGEEPEWLDDEEKFQRLIGRSGVLGTGQRIVDIVHPIYDTKSDNWLDAALDFATGEAPALSWLGKVGQGAAALTQGEYGDSAKYFTKSAPYVGPLNTISDAVGVRAKDLFGS